MNFFSVLLCVLFFVFMVSTYQIQLFNKLYLEEKGREVDYKICSVTINDLKNLSCVFLDSYFC
jgi:hypothetical protein